MLDRTPRMKSPLRLNVGGVSFFGRGKLANFFTAAINAKAGAIYAVFLVEVCAEWKIGLSHEALQLLIGQRPARVSALCGLRYFKADKQ